MNSKKILYFLAGLLVLVALYLVFFTDRGFSVTSYSPTLNDITTITPYIDIRFNQSVSESDFSISSPDNIVTRYILESPEDVRIFLTVPLNNNQKYKIILDKIISNKGSEINYKTISFTPLYTDPSLIPKSQIKYLTSEQDESASEIYGTTLVNILPFYSPGFIFSVTYNIVNNKPAIIITSATSSGVSQAETWITNQGYNISSLNINVVNQQPI